MSDLEGGRHQIKPFCYLGRTDIVTSGGISWLTLNNPQSDNCAQPAEFLFVNITQNYPDRLIGRAISFWLGIPSHQLSKPL